MEQWAVDPHAEMAKRGWSMVKEAPGDGYVDISGCQGIWKKIIRGSPEGAAGATPREGSFTEINYQYRYKGSTFDSSDAEYPLEIIPGGGMVVPGMEQAVLSMKRGELANFVLDPLFAFKENGFPPNVPEWAVVELEMELVDFAGPWTPAEQVTAGIEKKAEGNAHFAAGDHRLAIRAYNKGLDILGRRRRPLPPKMKDIEDAQHEVRVQILQNIMLCWFKMDNVERTIEYANNIIRQDPNNTKAHFRKARFELSKHNYYQAREHLEIIKAHDSTAQVQADIDAEFRKIAATEKQAREVEKNTAKKAARALSEA
ncbi:Peptidyl-prolyl cis-trans isomerase PASTICCINO1 [Diplonema papillatum]|nr:Peptidyl-prolyl cis-trans isomerase PASTICCINO1 [Diplonema papillatum]